MKLEVNKENNIYILKFTKPDNTCRNVQFSEAQYECLKEHFLPSSNLAYDSDFNILWDLHKKGNKTTAKKRFSKAIKKVSFTELKSLLEAYVKSNDFCYLKGLDVWLNPDKEHWNDPIVKKEDKFKKEEPKKSTFFQD